MPIFEYREAFSRNLGWVTESEQQSLRSKRVAIAGMGGVGGSHLLTLTRLGIGAFNLSDFDTFDVANFNRQAGAMVSTLGKPKVDTMRAMALDINPELDIRMFPGGVDDSNLDRFLDGVDLYVDSLDFFAFDARKKMFAACAAKGIPAVTAAPLGMGTAVLNFLPGGMTFEQYFRMEGQDEFEQGLRFLLGLAPARLHMGYLVDPSRINLAEKRGPSTIMACQLCAGMAATQALKILLKRGDVVVAPYGLHFDAYRNKLVRTHLPGGNGNPLQRIKLALARHMLKAAAQPRLSHRSVGEDASVLEQILDLARWAPSGDNTQVWRFEITGEYSCIIHTFDTRDEVVYDVDGRPSQLSVGALLETLDIAASRFGLAVRYARRGTAENETKSQYDVTLAPDPARHTSELFDQLTVRSVQRRPLSTAPLSAQQKHALESALGGHYRVEWMEGAAQRWKVARILFRNAKIRLTMPEAYKVHKAIIAWDAQYSEDRLPDRAVGLDPVGLKLMRWAMQSWGRVKLLNTYFAGTWLPRLQLDLIPGLACAAHFMLVAEQAPRTVDDYVAAGRAVQRFWLTASKLGLQLQPEMTPLIFASYVRANKHFSQEAGLWEQAVKLTAKLSAHVGEQTLSKAVFMGRVGAGTVATARSTRLPLSKLLVTPTAPR